MTTGLDAVVERKINALKKEAESSSKGLRNDGKPLTEHTEQSASFDRTKPDKIHAEFSRDGLSKVYTKARTQPGGGNVAEVIVSRSQHEFLAELERSYQVRSRSRIVSVSIAASSREFFGETDGIFDMLKKDLIQPLKTGATG
jgi:hypothetical protein